MLNNPKAFVVALRKGVAGLYEVFDLAAERPCDNERRGWRRPVDELAVSANLNEAR